MKLLVAAALLGLASAAPYCPPSNMDWSCCSSSNKCAAGGGDCDSDADCLSGNCVHDVGFLYGTHWSMDVCDPSAPDMCYGDFNNDLPGTNPSEISGPWRERARAVVKLAKSGGGGICTAFKYSADLYATNAHCGTDLDTIIFDHECSPGEDLDTCGGNQSKTCSVNYIDGDVFPPYTPSMDWAIYRLDGYCSHNNGRNWLHIAPLQSAASLNGQKIVVIHHPAGHRKIIHGLTNISPGTPNSGSSWNNALDCSVLSATVEPGVIRTQCLRAGVQKVVPIAGGSSGAPVFNTAGQVITINNGNYGCGRFHSMGQDNVHSTFYPMYPQTDTCTLPWNCVGRRPEVEESLQAPVKRPEEEEDDTGNQGSLQAPEKRVEIPL